MSADNPALSNLPPSPERIAKVTQFMDSIDPGQFKLMPPSGVITAPKYTDIFLHAEVSVDPVPKTFAEAETPTTEVDKSEDETTDELEDEQVDTSILDAVVEGISATYTAENGLEPPKPIEPKALGGSLSEVSSFTTHSFRDFDDSDYVPPTPKERLENIKKEVRRLIEEERTIPDDARKKDIFGESYTLVSKFNIRDVSFLPKKEDVGTMNRVAFLRYLQQLGMVLVDDTGMNANGTRTSTAESFVFLPDELDKDAYFALENRVRSIAPFTDYEVRSMQLQAEINGKGHIAAKNWEVDARLMHEIVDLFATDEQFAPLFDKADAVTKARKAYKKPEPVKLEDITLIPGIPTQDY